MIRGQGEDIIQCGARADPGGRAGQFLDRAGTHVSDVLLLCFVFCGPSSSFPVWLGPRADAMTRPVRTKSVTASPRRRPAGTFSCSGRVWIVPTRRFLSRSEQNPVRVPRCYPGPRGKPDRLSGYPFPRTSFWSPIVAVTGKTITCGVGRGPDGVLSKRPGTILLFPRSRRRCFSVCPEN